MSLDPVVSNPQHYKTVFENEHVRVLEYNDVPGDKSTPHEHPNSVMYALSTFHRRIAMGEKFRDLVVEAGSTNWLPAQTHYGENTGDTPTHVIFVELKGTAGDPTAHGQLGVDQRP